MSFKEFLAERRMLYLPWDDFDWAKRELYDLNIKIYKTSTGFSFWADDERQLVRWLSKIGHGGLASSISSRE